MSTERRVRTRWAARLWGAVRRARADEIVIDYEGSPLPPELVRRRRRYTIRLLTVCVLGLVPWTIFLALTLPDQYRSEHWRLTWAGFDGLLLLGMGLTAYFGWRGRQAVVPAAVATATLLVCDAWFDVSLSLGTPQVWWSVASAGLIELPLAAFFVRRVSMLVSLMVEGAYHQLGIEGRPPPFLKMPLFGMLRVPERERVREREDD